MLLLMATEHSMIKATKQEFITYLGKEKDCIHEIKEKKKSGALSWLFTFTYFAFPKQPALSTWSVVAKSSYIHNYQNGQEKKECRNCYKIVEEQ